jgi:hypothetical protein
MACGVRKFDRAWKSPGSEADRVCAPHRLHHAQELRIVATGPNGYDEAVIAGVVRP